MGPNDCDCECGGPGFGWRPGGGGGGGGGSTFAGETYFVLDPLAGADAGNVFTTWDALYAKLPPVENRPAFIWVNNDATLGTTGNTYDISKLRFFGAQAQDPGAVPFNTALRLITIPDGVLLTAQAGSDVTFADLRFLTQNTTVPTWTANDIGISFTRCQGGNDSTCLPFISNDSGALVLNFQENIGWNPVDGLASAFGVFACVSTGAGIVINLWDTASDSGSTVIPNFGQGCFSDDGTTLCNLFVNIFSPILGIVTPTGPAYPQFSSTISVTYNTSPAAMIATSKNGTTPAAGVALITTDAFGTLDFGAPSITASWTEAGGIVFLTTTNDQVGVGTATPNAARKMEVLATGTNIGIRSRVAASTDTALDLFVTGDTTARFGSTAAGALSWSDGTAAADTRLRRSAAKTLVLDDGASGAANFYPGADTVGQVGDGTHRWGLIRGLTVTSGDLCFDDAACPKCGAGFAAGQELTMHVIAIEPDTSMPYGIPQYHADGRPRLLTRTVPAHRDCGA